MISSPLSTDIDARFKVVDDHFKVVIGRLDRQDRAVAGLARGLGGVVEMLGRSAAIAQDDKRYWLGATFATVEDVCASLSTPTHCASPCAVEDALVEEHRGYDALATTVGRELAKRGMSTGSVSGGGAGDSWRDRLEFWEQEACRNRSRMTRWLGRCLHMLLSYCETAHRMSGSSSAAARAELAQLLRKRLRSGEQPALAMAAALACGSLRRELELDGGPRLEVTAGEVTIRVLEVKTSTDKGARGTGGLGGQPTSPARALAGSGCARGAATGRRGSTVPCEKTCMPAYACAVSEGVEQAKAAAAILAWAVHVANAGLLRGRSLRLVAVVRTLGRLTTAQLCRWHNKDEVLKLAVPASGGASLRVELESIP
eukprot:scaffold22.g6124.t1